MKKILSFLIIILFIISMFLFTQNTVYKFADFSIANKTNGSINDEEYFEFTTDKDLKAIVKYKDYQEKITISYQGI